MSKNKSDKKRLGAAAKWIPPESEKIHTISKSDLDKYARIGAAENKTSSEILDAVFPDNPFKDESPHILFARAQQGHAHSALRILQLAEEFTMLLGELAATNPAMLKPLAKHRALWPVLDGKHPKAKKKNLALFQKIGLGKELDVTHEIERLGLITTTAKQWAWLLIRLIRAVCAATHSMRDIIKHLREDGEKREQWLLHYGWHWFLKTLAASLPTLPFDELKLTPALMNSCEHIDALTADKTVIDSWWLVAQDLLMLNTGGHPETYPELRKIGASRATHLSGVEFIRDSPRSRSNQKTIEVVVIDGVSYNKDRMESNIRSKIFTELRDEFNQFAKQYASLSI